LSELRERFISTLDLKENEIVRPSVDTKIFVCIGAILDKEKKKSFDLKEFKNIQKKRANI
jgi:activator of 2-hydroxyglutaryl-CoA dehydratase